jgi:hypothetical protein
VGNWKVISSVLTIYYSADNTHQKKSQTIYIHKLKALLNSLLTLAFHVKTIPFVHTICFKHGNRLGNESDVSKRHYIKKKFLLNQPG